MTSPLRKSLEALTRKDQSLSDARKAIVDFAEEVIKVTERNTSVRDRINKEMKNGARAGSRRFRI